MKLFYLVSILLLTITFTSMFAQDKGNLNNGRHCPGIPTVTYSGKTYNTVLIEDQCWLKENLDVGEMIQGNVDMQDNGKIEKYCYDNDPSNCETYGGLYQWNEAMNYSTSQGAQGICPEGWHIPTMAEFGQLNITVNGDGNALKAIGQGTGPGAGTNTSGFTALLAGDRGSNGSFYDLGSSPLFWSSTEDGSDYASFVGLSDSDSGIYLGTGGKDAGFSVRCVKD